MVLKERTEVPTKHLINGSHSGPEIIDIVEFPTHPTQDCVDVVQEKISVPIKLAKLDLERNIFPDDELSFKQYKHEIGRIPLLTPDEEKLLVIKATDGKSAAKRLRQQPQLSQTEQEELEQMRVAGIEATDHLVGANLRLVLHYAKRFMYRGLPIKDLIQEGNMGLMHAIDKFDPERGTRVSTYATSWIKQFMGRAIVDKARIIGIPANMHGDMAKLKRITLRMEDELGRKPTITELAEAMGKSKKRTRALQAWINNEPESLDTPKYHNSGEEEDKESSIPDHVFETPEDAAMRGYLEEQIGLLLDSLDDPREKKVLQLRFGIGLEINREWTLEEVGREFGFSRERARQLEEEGLKKLRKTSLGKKLFESFVRQP